MLGGFESQAALADRVALPRLSARNIRKIESDERELEPHEAQAIASACAIDVAFFRVDLADLSGPQSDPERAAEELAAHALEAAQAILRERAQAGEGSARQGR